MSTIGERLHAARTLRGLSHERLAMKSHVGRQTIINVEKHGRIPRADRLRALAEALEVSADYLLGLSDDPGPRVEVTAEAAERVLESFDAAREAAEPPPPGERRRHSRRATDPPPP